MERVELIALLRATGCAEEHGGLVFLCDPSWGPGERTALALVAQRAAIDHRKSKNNEGWLCVPTGGTSGGVRLARHDEKTLSAAVSGFCRHFELARVNAIDVLPAHHVSGLMARVRCAATGGQHVAWDWKRLEAGRRPELNPTRGGWVISLVPTQLQRLLAQPAAVAWLRGFEIIFIGGGPIWPDLADAAAAEKLPLALTYGMTETAAMIAALRPVEFLAGARSCGVALPHARIVLDDEGVVVVGGASLFRGYFPEGTGTVDSAGPGRPGKCHLLDDTSTPAGSEQRGWVTQDLGRFDERGHLHVLGRRDAVIITGGKKVNPVEVEAALRASGEFEDVAVVGVPDVEWGEAVVACYLERGTGAPNLGRAVERLAGFQRPKRFVPIKDWPRNAQGKLNRAALQSVAARE